MKKVYELKKGTKLFYNDEIITFEEIKGEKAIFYNEWGIEYEFPDYLNIDEIGEIISDIYIYKATNKYPTLF